MAIEAPVLPRSLSTPTSSAAQGGDAATDARWWRRRLTAGISVWTTTLKKDIQINWNGVRHILHRREEPAPGSSSVRASSAAQGGDGAARMALDVLGGSVSKPHESGRDYEAGHPEFQISLNGIGHILSAREEHVPMLVRSSSARASSAAQGSDGARQSGRRRLTSRQR